MAIVFVLAFIGCNPFHGLVFRVVTNSMAPTIKEGDTIFCDRLFYKLSPLRRGDIVIVKDPEGRTNPDGSVQMYPKRIIGLGRDKVQVIAGKVYVNDNLLSGVLGRGKYFSDMPVEDFGPLVVPQGEYFLVGDNLANSYDSRLWKNSTVKIESIYGKVTQIKDKETGEQRSL